jgi:hypothetical protein
MRGDWQKESAQRTQIINEAKNRDGYVFMMDSGEADNSDGILAVKASRTQTVREADLADDGSETNQVCGEGIIHWDGYNHCALIFASGEYEVDLGMVTDFQAIKELELAIETRKLEKETPAGKHYRSGTYSLFESYSETRWEDYSMRKAD